MKHYIVTMTYEVEADNEEAAMEAALEAAHWEDDPDNIEVEETRTA